MKNMRMKLIGSFGVLLLSIVFIHSEAMGQCEGFCLQGPPPLPDCNNNGICDWEEINNDTDCNGNCVLDVCELGPDCNDDGILDLCQLAGNDCNGNEVPDDCETSCCPWDVTGDGFVGEADLDVLLEQWGTLSPCTPGCAAGDNACKADFDRNCEINVTDLLDLLAHWGSCGRCLPLITWCSPP